MDQTGKWKLALVPALFLLVWTVLLAARLVVAAIRGQWVVVFVGAAVLTGSAGMTAWAWTTVRRDEE